VDIDEAGEAWGANCGPTALAAALELRHVERVRPYLGEFKGFMAPRDMLAALGEAGVSVTVEKIIRRRTPWPRYGLVRVQWEGPWCDEGVDPRAAYRYTHWIAARHPSHEEAAGLGLNARDIIVFDGNLNFWLPLALWSTWCELLYPKRATGWHVASCFNIHRVTSYAGPSSTYAA